MNNIIVTTSCSELRSLGRQALAGKWSVAVLGSLLFGALTTIPALLLVMPEIINGAAADPDSLSSSLGGYVANIYSMLVQGPLTLGYTGLLLNIFRRWPARSVEVFYGFEKFGKAFLLMIVQSVFIFLWSLLFIVPGIIAALRYSMAFFVLADNPEIGVMGALAESKRLMRGNKIQYFVMNLSFIGWCLLVPLTMGIGGLFLMPYMKAAQTAFYEIANGNLRRTDDLEMPQGPSQTNPPGGWPADSPPSAKTILPPTESAEPTFEDRLREAANSFDPRN